MTRGCAKEQGVYRPSTSRRLRSTAASGELPHKGVERRALHGLDHTLCHGWPGESGNRRVGEEVVAKALNREVRREWDDQCVSASDVNRSDADNDCRSPLDPGAVRKANVDKEDVAAATRRRRWRRRHCPKRLPHRVLPGVDESRRFSQRGRLRCSVEPVFAGNTGEGFDLFVTQLVHEPVEGLSR
jgi:hypothetical protein